MQPEIEVASTRGSPSSGLQLVGSRFWAGPNFRNIHLRRLVKGSATMKTYNVAEICVLLTMQPDIKSNPNLNANLSTKQLAIVSIQLCIVTCHTYPEKFIRDNSVIAPFLRLYVVIVTLPL